VSSRRDLGDYDDDNVLPPEYIGEITREEPTIAHSFAATHLIRISKGILDSVSESRQKVRVSLCDMSFPLATKFYIAI